MNYIGEYSQCINDGSIITSKWIHLLYDYITKGLDEGLFFFDQNKADDVINWVENNCYHTEGPLAPNLLKLELWQKALLSIMFGIVIKVAGVFFVKLFWLSHAKMANRCLRQQSPTMSGSVAGTEQEFFVLPQSSTRRQSYTIQFGIRQYYRQITKV